MKTTSESLAAKENTRQDWALLLEEATREVFALMLNSQLTVPETLSKEPLDVTAMVGLAGQLRGVLILRCSRNSGVLMATRMLGAKVDERGPELADALGEIANMIAGNFKNKISGLAEGCMLTVPTVIIGNDYDLKSLTVFDTIDLQRLFEDAPITVSVAIHGRPSSVVRSPL
jgi:chemotaxis protein CheX